MTKPLCFYKPGREPSHIPVAVQLEQSGRAIREMRYYAPCGLGPMGGMAQCVGRDVLSFSGSARPEEIASVAEHLSCRPPLRWNWLNQEWEAESP